MRLIVRKVYRAFPELDRFSDAECEGFVGLVARRHRRGRVVRLVGLAVASGLLFFGGSYLTYSIGDELFRSGRAPKFVQDYWHLLVGILASGVVALLFTSVCRTVWLRSKIQHHLTALECIECAYSLLGLPVVEGAITCPECGQRFDLAARGLTAADVLGQATPPTCS